MKIMGTSCSIQALLDMIEALGAADWLRPSLSIASVKSPSALTTLHWYAQNVSETRVVIGEGAAHASSQPCATICIVLTPTPIIPQAVEQVRPQTSRSAHLRLVNYALEAECI